MSLCVSYVEESEKGVIRFNFQVESSQVRGGKTKEAAAREFNVDLRRNSETVMEIALFFLY